MDARDATGLIAPGVSGRVWADLGAGRGTFTMALATLLGPAGRVYAVERDATAIDALERLGGRRGHDERALIEVVPGDFATAQLALDDIDGILMANSLHYVPDADQALLLARESAFGGTMYAALLQQ